MSNSDTFNRLRSTFPQYANLSDDDFLNFLNPPAAMPAPASDQPVSGTPDRTWGEVAIDTGLGLVQGFVTMGADLSNLAGYLPGLDTSSATESLQGMEEWLQGKKSDKLQALTNEFGEIEGFLPTVKFAAQNPTFIADSLVSSLAYVVPGGLAARGSAAIAAGGAKAKGLIGPAAQQYITRRATAGVAASQGLLEGANSARQASNEIYQMTPEQLWTGSDTYQDLINQGMSHEDAINDIATSAGLTAMAVTVPIATLAGLVTGASEIQARFFTGQGLKNFGKVFGASIASNAVQEGGNQFGTGTGVQQFGDADRNPWRDVGRGAAIGGITGGAQGGAMAITQGLVSEAPSIRSAGREEDQRHEAGNQAAAEAAAHGGDPLDQELAAATAEAQFTPAPDYSQFDRPAAQRDVESERSMSGVDGLIITAERMGFTDEAAQLITAKRLFRKADEAKAAGNDRMASLYVRQANSLYRRATETNEALAAEAANYPTPYVFQGDISGGEIVSAASVGPTGEVFTQQPDPARVTGTRGMLEDSGTIFAPEPADVAATRQQREADNFSAFYGQEGTAQVRADALVGELDRSNELPPAARRQALPPGIGQINMGRDAQGPVAPVDGRAAAVGRNTIERQASTPTALPAGRQTRAITPEQYRGIMDLARQAVRTPVRNRTPEMQQAIAVRQAVRAGDIQVSEAATPSSIVGQRINDEWTAFSDDSGTLKIPRSDMPQVKAEHRGALVNFLNARGIEHQQAEIDPATLKPTQAEFSPAKVQKAREYQGGDRSILISSDGHVVDGHHQWMAKRDAGEPIKVIQLNAPISDLVPLIKEFPSSEQDAGAGRAGQETPQQQSAPRSVAAITKRNRNAINADEDSMLVAIAKLGGLDRTLAEQEGVDPAYFNTREGIRWAFKRNGGRSFDGMAEVLEQYGYLDSADRFRDFSDKLFRSLAGESIYTAEGMYRQMENQAAEDANSAMADAVRGRDEAVLADAGEYSGPDGVSIESLHMAQEALRAGMSEDAVIQSILASDFPIDFVVNVFTGEQDGRSESSRGRETDANDQERRAPEENAGRDPSRAAETGREGQGNAPESEELLTSYSEQDLQAQSESQQASEQAALRTQAQAEQRAQADAEVSDFTLTGSNRAADVAAARGQNDLFGAKARSVQQVEDRSDSGTALYSGYERETSDLQVKQRPSPELSAAGQFDLFAPASIPAETAATQSRDNFAVRYKQVPVGSIKSAFDVVTTPSEVAHVLAPFRKHGQETMLAVVTDKQGKVINLIRHTKGGKAASSVYPAELVAAIASTPNAANVWFGHNHPSGSLFPSQADYNITDVLVSVMDGTGVEFKGHVIVAPGGKNATLFTERDQGQKIPVKAGSRKRDIAITERVLRKRDMLGQPEINSPDSAKRVVERLEAENAILLLSNSHSVIGSLAMSSEEMQALREGGRVNRILRAIDETNTAAIIIKADNSDAAANVARFMNNLRDIRVLDWFRPTTFGYMSDASRNGGVADSTGPFFSIGDGQSDSVAVAGVQSQIDQITTDWQNAPEISVVETEAELPEAIRQAASEQDVEGAIEGVMYRGKVYIVASRMKDQADVERVLFHEALGHYGLKQLYGPALELHLDQLWRRIGGIKGVRRLEKQYGFNLSPYWEGSEGWSAKERRQMMSDELIAHLAGKGDIEPTLMQRIAHLIRRGLRKLFRNTALADGLDGMSDIEVLQIVAGARRAVVEGRSTVTYLTHDPDYVAAFYSVMYSRGADDTGPRFSRVPDDAPVIETDGGPIARGKTLKEMSNRALLLANRFANTTVQNRDHGDEIIISKKGVKHTLRGAQPDLIKTVAVTPEILEQGVFLGTEPDKRGNPDIVASHFYGVKVSVDGRVHDIVAVVKEHNDGKRYYDHSIERKKEEGVQTGKSNVPRTPSTETDDTASNFSIASDTEASTVPLSNENLRAAMRAVLPEFKDGDDRAVIVDSFDGLPEKVQQDAKDQGSNGNDVEGVLHKGKIYIVADKITSASQVETLLFHEGTHGGVNALYADEGVNRAMNRLYAAMGGSAGFNKVVDQLGIRNKIDPYLKGTMQRDGGGNTAMPRELRNTILMQEVLAYTGEKGSKGVKLRLQELVGAVRNWLRENGFVSLSELGVTDIAYIAKQAREQGLKRSSDGGVTLFRFGERIRQTINRQRDDFVTDTGRIESRLKEFMKLRAVWDSASDVLKRTPELKPIGDAIDQFYDQTRENMGIVNRIIDPVAKRMRKAKKAEREAALQEFEAYMRARENGESTNEILSDLSQAMVDAWAEVADVTGTMNQEAGVQVYDAGIKGWRGIGKLKNFWPRSMNERVQEALLHPSKHPDTWREMARVLHEDGRIEAPTYELASAYLGAQLNEMNDVTSQDYFAGIEKARGEALPDYFYDYSWDNAMSYKDRWAENLSRIEAFGQRAVTGKDMIDEIAGTINDDATLKFLKAAQDRVYNVVPNDSYVRGMAALNTLATGIQLGNPGTAMLNLIGGTSLNFQTFGFTNSIKGLASELKDMAQHMKEAREIGILIDDYQMLVQDAAEAGLSTNLQKFTSGMLKWGGYTPMETFIRTHAYVTSKTMLRQALDSWNSNIESKKSLKALAWYQRNGFNTDKLIAENGSGPETRRLYRKQVNMTQGSYRIDQTPIFVDSPIGKFLFKYQKFGTQLSRTFWINILKPFIDSVAKGGETVTYTKDGREYSARVRTFMPMLNFFGGAILSGTALALLREAAFGYQDPGPDLDEIEKALADDDTAYAVALAAKRAWSSMMAVGALGFFGNYVQMMKDVSDRQRVKSPLNPPAIAPLQAIGDLALTYGEQGTLTAKDMDRFADTLSIYRTGKRASLAALSTVTDLDVAELEMARRDRNYIRKVARRYADVIGLENKRRAPDRYGKTEMSPINARLIDAVMLGQTERAKAIMRDHLSGLSTQQEIDSALTSMRGAIRAAQPVRVSISPSQRERREFLKWAEGRVSPEKYARMMELDTRFTETAIAVGLMNRVKERDIIRQARRNDRVTREMTPGQVDRYLRANGL